MDYSPIELTGLTNKEAVRQAVWRYIYTEEGLREDSSRSVVGTIPWFAGCHTACNQLLQLEAFQRATLVKVNPDKASTQARYLVLQRQKTLLVPTPRLKTGLFNRIVPGTSDEATLQLCSTKKAIRTHSVPIGLEEVQCPDLIIVGSVAVDRNGHRIGKGGGYADLEHGILCSTVGFNFSHTTIVSIVADCQVFDRLNSQLSFEPHDFSLDYILTPTRIIKCEKTNWQPTKEGPILWDRLDQAKFAEIPILGELRKRLKYGKQSDRLND